MQARMKNPALLNPDTLKALQALGASVADAGIPPRTLELVHLRASQINGCSVCVDMHAHALKKGGESDQRIYAVGAWRDAPWFTDAERAALALTEALTRLSDTSDAVPDTLWQEVARHFDERALGALVVTIAQINLWNRLNVATRQVAGAFR